MYSIFRGNWQETFINLIDRLEELAYNKYGKLEVCNRKKRMKGITHETLESHIRAVLASACAGNDGCLRGDTRRENGIGRETCHFCTAGGGKIHFSYDAPENYVVKKMAVAFCLYGWAWLFWQ